MLLYKKLLLITFGTTYVQSVFNQVVSQMTEMLNLFNEKAYKYT